MTTDSVSTGNLQEDRESKRAKEPENEREQEHLKVGGEIKKFTGCSKQYVDLNLDHESNMLWGGNGNH